MSIFLTGYRGSGKTTLGRKLADRFRLPFIDCDDLIVKKAGKSIREIFKQDGEKAFRDLESDVIRHVATLKDHVIALGGGALVREENREALKTAHQKVIYLRCEPGELLRRIQNDTATAQTRPNLTALGGGLAEIQTILAGREPLYQSAMTAELDVTHLTPDEAVVCVVRLL